MWKRILNVKWYAHFIYLLIKYSPNKKKLIARPNEIYGDRDVSGLLDKYPAHLSFTDSEEEIANKYLKKMGITTNDSFVGLAIRDSNYLLNTKPFNNWSYHDFRNCKIDNYSLAVKEIINKNNYVIRMGTHVKETMNFNNPKYIEYSYNGYRTELMDIYIGAKCKYFISCGTGIDSIAVIFRRPLLYTNYIPIEAVETFRSNSLVIFKKHWLKEKKRFMTFKEIYESGAGKFALGDEFESHGIELVENTKDEILDVVKEMDSRIEGTWEKNQDDDELQKRFWSTFPFDKAFHGEIKTRIGAEFLRQNNNLLN